MPYTVGVPNIPLHHLLRSAVRRFPLRPAIYFEGSRLSYRRLNHEANRFANALIALGVGKGARIVLLLPNVPQMVIGFYGTMKAGAAAVFVPPVIEPEEVLRQVKDSEASVLVTLSMWAGLAKQIQESCGIPHVVLTDPADYLSLPKLIDLKLAKSRLRTAQRGPLEGLSGRQHHQIADRGSDAARPCGDPIYGRDDRAIEGRDAFAP